MLVLEESSSPRALVWDENMGPASAKQRAIDKLPVQPRSIKTDVSVAASDIFPLGVLYPIPSRPK
jgi:hypothetical protein